MTSKNDIQIGDIIEVVDYNRLYVNKGTVCKVTEIRDDRVMTDCIEPERSKGARYVVLYAWIDEGACKLRPRGPAPIVLIEVDMGGSLTTQAIPASEFDPKKHKKFKLY